MKRGLGTGPLMPQQPTVIGPVLNPVGR